MGLNWRINFPLKNPEPFQLQRKTKMKQTLTKRIALRQAGKSPEILQGLIF